MGRAEIVRLAVAAGFSSAVIAGGAAVAQNSSNAAGSTVRACVKKTDGTVRVIGAKGKCRSNERLVQLAQGGLQGASTGTPGIQGPPGTAGAAGAAGAKGDPGAAGAAGAPGAKGDTGAQGAQGAQGPAGPRGPQGPVGPQGPAGEAPKDPPPAYSPTFALNINGETTAVSRLAGCREPVLGGELEDCVVRISQVPAGQLATWISDTRKGGTFALRDVAIQGLTTNLDVSAQLDLDDAFLSRVEVSELEATTRTAGFIELTITPEALKLSSPGGKVTLPANKAWLVSNFRMSPDGVAGGQFVRATGLGFTVGKTPAVVDGLPRFTPGAMTQLPAVLEFGPAGATATDMRAWVESVRTKGSDRRDVAVELLNAAFTDTLWTWTLGEAQPRSAVEPFAVGAGGTTGRLSTTLAVQESRLG